MAEGFKYQLVFDTVLNPEGGNAALRTIDAVNTASARASGVSTANTSAIGRAMTDNAAKAKVSEIAYYNLDEAMRKTNATSASFSTGQTRVQSSTRNSSSALLMFSQGFEDAQYGIRGVLNNIPGLVMALGGGMGLAGAVSLAAVGFSILVDFFGKADKSAGMTAEKIDDLVAAAGKVESDKIDSMTRSLWDAWDAADAVRQGFDDTKKAADSFATSALDDAGKRAAAEQLVAIALGEQVSAYATLEARATAEAEKRQLAAKQAITAQQDAITLANEEVSIAEKKRQTAIADRETQKQALALVRSQLAEMEKVDAALRERGSKKVGAGAFLPDGPETGIPFISPTQDAKKANETREVQGYDIALKGLRERVDVLASAVEDSGSSLNRKVVALDVDVQKTQTEATNKIAAAAVKIQELKNTLSADTARADAQLAVDQGKALAEGIKTALGDIKAGNAQQEAAKKEISKAASDGIVTGAEIADLSRNLTALVGGLQTGVSTTNGNVAELIGVIRSLQDANLVFSREIKALKAKSR